MAETAELINNDFQRQFELSHDGHLAIIEYAPQERKIFLTKLIIPEDIKNENFKNDFLTLVFEDIASRNLSVMPTCPIIAKFVRSNRKYKRLLPAGVRI